MKVDLKLVCNNNKIFFGKEVTGQPGTPSRMPTNMSLCPAHLIIVIGTTSSPSDICNPKPNFWRKCLRLRVSPWVSLLLLISRKHLLCHLYVTFIYEIKIRKNDDLVGWWECFVLTGFKCWKFGSTCGYEKGGRRFKVPLATHDPRDFRDIGHMTPFS